MSDCARMIAGDPYARFLGIAVEKVEQGYASCSLAVAEHMLNFLGALHGGLVFSLADVAFSAASNRDHSPSYALDISGSFLRSARVGDIIRAEAVMIHATRRTGLYRMEVTNKGELIAVFNGTVFRKEGKP